MKMKVGDQRFYPPHGVVTLQAIEEREFGGEKADFYILEVLRGGTILLPTIGEGFRKLVTATEAKALRKKLKSKAAPKIDESVDAKTRTAALNEKLKEGKASDYTAILHEMNYRAREGKLSAGEQKLLEMARTFYIDEISTVSSATAAELRDELDALSRPPES